MNRKVFNIRFAKRIVSFVLCLGVIFGILLILNGVFQLKSYKDKIGGMTLEESESETAPIHDELAEIQHQKNEEAAKNGISDRYAELARKENELRAQSSDKLDREFMLYYGYHNPQTFGEMLETAPTLWIGVVVIAASIILMIISKMLFNKYDKKADKKPSLAE